MRYVGVGVLWMLSLTLSFVCGLFLSAFLARRRAGLSGEKRERRKNQMKRWPLFSIAALSIVLIGVRMIWPALKVDSTSLILLGVAAACTLVALLPITKFKWGDLEVELERNKKLDELEKKVTRFEISGIHVELPKSEDGLTTPPEPRDAASLSPRQTSQSKETRDTYDDFIDLLNSPASDVEKILAASVLFEKTVEKAVIAAGGTIINRGVRQGLKQLVVLDKLGEGEEALFTDVWQMRNELIHEGVKPTSEQATRFLDILRPLILRLSVI
jgi:hypothetical protein